MRMSCSKHHFRALLLMLSLRACAALLSSAPIINASPGALGGLSRCIPGLAPPPTRPPGASRMIPLRGKKSWLGSLFQPQGAPMGSCGGLMALSTSTEDSAPPAPALPAREREADGYKLPPPEIASLIQAEGTPGLLLSPPAAGCKWFAKTRSDPMLSIADLAEPEEKLAGVRFNPHLDVPSRRVRSHTISIVDRHTNEERAVQGIPDGAYISGISFSADGTRLALNVLTREKGLQLYTLDPAAPVAKLATERRLSSVINAAYAWVDSDKIIVNAVPGTRPPPPESPRVPSAPVVESTTGETAPGRTYQDLLKNAHQEALFEHYATTQLVEVDLKTGRERNIGPLAMHTDIDVAPGGRFLLTKTLQRPFSRQVTYGRFAYDADVWDLAEASPTAAKVASLPLAERVPIGNDAVREGPREFGWRGDAASTLVWKEALDGGDPKAVVEHRDVMYMQEFPGGEKQELVRTQWRNRGVWWGDDDVALVRESDWKTRTSRMLQINTKAPRNSPKEPLLEYGSDDRYKHPGNPLTVRKPDGTRVLDRNGKAVLMQGVGGSDAGDRPFIDSRRLLGDGVGETNAEAERLWRCEEGGVFETPIVLLREGEEIVLLTSRETNVDVPNVWEVKMRSGERKQVTFTEHPQPALLGVQKKLIKYKRKDGLELSGMLYLPVGYTPEKEGALPTLLWAYPQEFKNASSASQVQGSPHRFIRVPPTSPLLWLSRGYAVLDNPAMPIVGENGKEENDNFIEQLVASAEAAVLELQRMGVSDHRVAVGGHSYGAFMTANLLAHSRLFKAGIGRTGAYNRLLTPFGFQSEERTLWEAPETYLQMSPFMHADKIEAPLLLLHGEADNNPGTFPLQSERLFGALKGLGKTSRLVVLPLEGHGYIAQESVLHMCAEMDAWLQEHLK